MTLAATNSIDAETLVLDEHTLFDLEIFASSTGGASLFKLCNLTQTKGGAKVLQRRMEGPWAEASQIRATQESISFILKHRKVFTMLPSAYSTNRAEHYAREVLPIVVEENPLEFILGAFTLWANHDSHYISIMHGVHFTTDIIQTLRLLIDHAELDSPGGDLVPIFAEMRALLARPGLLAVPDREPASWIWKILRLDQTYRTHEKKSVARLLQLIFEIDALVAMADVTLANNFTLPTIDEGSLCVEAEGLIHPFLSDAIANPVDLDQDRRVLFLTGPNMAGKTTYLRAFATALYLAHLGMGVPASRFRFSPAQRLFSSISLNDDLGSGISYFRAEALRVKAIASAIADGYRVVAVMDEPFKGTNVKDSFDASLAILKRFSVRKDCLFMFSSHLIELSEHLGSASHVYCCFFEADETGGTLQFDYLLRAGISNQRLGMRVLREEGVFDLLDAGDTAD